MIRIVPAAALVVALAGCTATPAPETSPAPADDFSIEAAVAALPPVDGQLWISVGDVTAAADATGLALPQADEVADFLRATTGSVQGDPVSLPWPAALGTAQPDRHGEFVAAVGFGISDVTSFVGVAAPPTAFTLLDGSFDVDAITGALGEPVDRVWAQPGEDFGLDLTAPTVVDDLGRPVRVAGDASQVALTLSTRLAVDYLDGVVSDRPDLLTAARLLDEEGAYAAEFLVDDDLVIGIGLVAGPDGSTPVAVRVAPGTLPDAGDEVGPATVTEVVDEGGTALIQLSWPPDTAPVIAWRLVGALLP